MCRDWIIKEKSWKMEGTANTWGESAAHESPSHLVLDSHVRPWRGLWLSVSVVSRLSAETWRWASAYRVVSMKTCDGTKGFGLANMEYVFETLVFFIVCCNDSEGFCSFHWRVNLSSPETPGNASCLLAAFLFVYWQPRPQTIELLPPSLVCVVKERCC